MVNGGLHPRQAAGFACPPGEASVDSGTPLLPHAGMADPTTSGLRRALAAVLIVALMLAGIGRSIASTLLPEGALPAIAGVVMPICHSGTGRDPADSGRHDCCDDCALLAPVVLPVAPSLSGPAPAAHHAVHARAMAWMPVLLRPRSPRQSQGPPVA